MFLLISVCLIANPGQCREERVDVSMDSPNAAICLRNSQGMLAQWAGDHPEWSIRKWRCAARGMVPSDL